MGKFVWRSFILMVIFISGLLVGNIFAPKQVLQEKDIVSVVKVQTSLDLDKEDNFIALAQNPNIEEVFDAFLRQNYQKAKLEYEYQLQNITKNPQDQKDFIKAQKNYLAIVNYIEENYSSVQEETDINDTITAEQTAQVQIETDLTPQATQAKTI